MPKLSRIAALALLLGPAASGAQPYRVPTWGTWAGHPVGTWILRRSTSRTPEKTKVWHYRHLLLGENQYGHVVTAFGEADESGKFKGKPNVSYSRPGPHPRDPRPKSRRAGVLRRGEGSVEVEFQEFAPRRSYKDAVTTSSLVVLKARPSFVVESRSVRTDSFRGETYRSTKERKLIRIERATHLGRTVRVFVWEETRDDGDGKQYKSRAFMSPDVPRREIRSQSLDRDVNGLPGHETELVGWGCAPEEARPLAEARKESMDERKESEKRTDIERLARQGRRIEQAWRKHQAEPNDATRAAILATGGMYLSDRMEFVVPTPDSRLMHPRWMIFQRPAPRAEKALLAIAKTNDPKLSVWAATQLVYMARDRHAPLLLRKLLEHKSADRRAVAALANTQVSPRPVLEALRPPLDDMPLGVVPHAHDGDAVTELLERYEVEKKADGHNTEECLEQLSVYDDPRVRALFAEMASRLKPEDGAKIGRVLHARVVLMAAATLHIKGSRKLLLRCIEWWIEDKENRFPEMRGFVGGGVAAAALLARDPVVTAALDRALKATPSPMALWMIAGTQEQDRAERQIRISADHLRQATAKPLNLFMGVAKEKELLPAMLPLCEAPSSETLARLLELYFPEYDPKLDFAEIYALKYKSWYSERVGRKAPDMKPWGNDLKTLCNALPWFGDDGLRILMHMGDYPPYRGAVLAAVRRIQPRTDELRAFVARQKKEILGTTDMPDEWPDQGVLFELGLTLWCYGDTEFRRHCEALLLRPPSHHVVTLTCDALAFLPRAEIVRLARLRHELGLPPRVLYGVAAALSHHGDKECGRLILELWDEVGDAGARPHFGACMNRVAGRNFGLRRRAMEDWALFPDGKKRDGRGPTH